MSAPGRGVCSPLNPFRFLFHVTVSSAATCDLHFTLWGISLPGWSPKSVHRAGIFEVLLGRQKVGHIDPQTPVAESLPVSHCPPLLPSGS